MHSYQFWIRELPDADRKHFVDCLNSSRPMIVEGGNGWPHCFPTAAAVSGVAPVEGVARAAV